MVSSPPHPESPEGGDREHSDASLPRILSPKPYVTEAEIEHRMAQELQAQRDANLHLDPRNAEIRVRAWLHREQLRRMHPHPKPSFFSADCITERKLADRHRMEESA